MMEDVRQGKHVRLNHNLPSMDRGNNLPTWRIKTTASIVNQNVLLTSPAGMLIELCVSNAMPVRHGPLIYFP